MPSPPACSRRAGGKRPWSVRWPTWRSCLSPQDRCAEDCVLPGGTPASAPAPLHREIVGPQQQDLACRPQHRCAEDCVSPRLFRPANAWRRGLARDGQGALSPRRPPLTSPQKLLLVACCTQEETRASPETYRMKSVQLDRQPRRTKKRAPQESRLGLGGTANSSGSGFSCYFKIEATTISRVRRTPVSTSMGASVN